MMLLSAKKVLHNLPLVNWHYWAQILSYHRNFWSCLLIFQLVSFISKIYVSHRFLMKKRNAVKMACMKRFLHTYLKCIDICMITKHFCQFCYICTKYIIVAIRGTFLPYLVQCTQNISLVDIGSITWSRTMVRLLRYGKVDTPDTVSTRNFWELSCK